MLRGSFIVWLHRNADRFDHLANGKPWTETEIGEVAEAFAGDMLRTRDSEEKHMSIKGNPNPPIQYPPGFINVADVTDPDDAQQRTYRQVNAEQTHSIPVGALVEIVGSDEYRGNGMRLFVVQQGRDCDQTPLYWLTNEPDDLEDAARRAESKSFLDRMHWIGGFSEGSLRVIRLSKEQTK